MRILSVCSFLGIDEMIDERDSKGSLVISKYNNGILMGAETMISSSKIRRTWAVFRLFAGFLLEIAWYNLMRKIFGVKMEARLPELYRNQAIRFRETALLLQGLMIKVGQFFSTRIDVLPVEYISELTLLQDQVPPVSSKQIKEVIELELGSKVEAVFAEFDEHHIAAASFGQVHQAVLLSGEMVAVKVLRPDIEKIIEIDLTAFRSVIWMLKVFTKWEKYADFDAIYAEFSATICEELDYRQELNHLEQFRANFQDDPMISVPAVYPEYSRQRVLTLEFVTGYKVTDRAGLLAAGINPKTVAGILLDAYLKQALIHGFYHADPHPGNLFVRSDGGIIFIDFGMVGRITEQNKKAVRKLISGVISSNAEEVSRALQELGFIKPTANLLSLQKAIALLLIGLQDMQLEELGKLKIDGLLEELREFIYSQPFQIPVHYTFLGRAVGTLSGIATGLDPNMNILAVIKPYAKQVLGQDLSPLQLVWQKAKQLALSGLEIPPLLEQTLRDFRAGDVQVKVEMGPVLRQLRFQETLANRIMWTILLAGTGIGAAVVWSNGQKDTAISLLYIMGVFALLLVNNLFKRAEKTLNWHRHSRR
ncbi:2-octaprenylphenol hydroxylase [Sporomusaceae bacterium FL31]|nr:2-octaprenylphenol hydroxylase [Sporomusaceae bacterium FL31]GCE35341.1 2-octaprenylphenol hydroxylase [Sporomusaceae bacterium]